MNKKELIKIFSAYLPYKTKVLLPDGQIRELAMVDVENHCVAPTESNGMCDVETVHKNGSGFKLCLYDLSNFERYFSQLFDDDLDVRTFLNNDFLTENNQFESLDDMLVNYKVEWWPYGVVQLALKHHFNIFGLKEDQFINKANLTETP